MAWGDGLFDPQTLHSQARPRAQVRMFVDNSLALTYVAARLFLTVAMGASAALLAVPGAGFIALKFAISQGLPPREFRRP